MRERREEGYFSFSWGKIGEQLLVAVAGAGAQLSRPQGIGTAAKTVRTAAQGGPATQLVEGCGLWPPFQLIQLIDLRYLCGSAEREKWMDVCFLLTLYLQYITKFGGCQKWKVEENGRDGKFWKARDCGRWIRRKGCVGGNGREVRWVPPNIFFLTFLWFYGILTVFSRREQKGRNRKCSYSLMKIAR